MIAKIVPRKKATGSFGGLVDYIEDKLGLHGEKVELVYSENCEFDTIEENIKEVKAIQSLYKGNADPTMHLLISFQEDEKPTPEDLKKITHEMLKSINMEHLQRVCATHIDTNNYHLHIAINRIDKNTNKRIDTFQSKRKLDKKMIELEEKLNLKKDNHIPNWLLAEQNLKSNSNKIKEEIIDERRNTEPIYTRRTNDNRDYTNEQRAVSIHKSDIEQPNRRTKADKLELLRELSSIEMVHDIERTEMLLQRDDDNQLGQEEQSNYSMRRQGISNNSNDRSDEQRINSRATDIKAHTGVSNLIDWIKENAILDIKEVLNNNTSTLEDLHTMLAKYNLELKERGNGLIIKDKSRNLFCKASDIHRDLSKNNLNKQYGDFMAMNIDIKPTIQFGTPKNDYWDKYKAKMDLQYKTKKELSIKLKEQYYKEREAIKAKWQINMQKVRKATYSRQLKQKAYQAIFSNQKKELNKLYQNYNTQKNQIIKTNKHITYKEYLIQEALKGDSGAVAMLRQQKVQSAPKEDENTLGGREDNTIFANLKPLITKLGHIVYRLSHKNNSKIIDKGNHIKLVNGNDNTVLRVLQMAQAKYGNTLEITGDSTFKTKVIEIVQKQKLGIKFTDENMNKTLQALKEQKTQTKKDKTIE